MKFEFD